MVQAKLDERRMAIAPALDPLFGFTRNVMQVLSKWFALSLTPYLAERIKHWFSRICHRTVRGAMGHVECAGAIAQELYGFGVRRTKDFSMQ